MDTGGLTINADTTGGDLIAVLTEDEVSCIRNALTEDAYTALLDKPAVDLNDPAFVFPGECLSAESNATLVVGVMAYESRGLSAGSTSCLRDTVAAENPASFWSNDPEVLASFGATFASTPLSPDRRGGCQAERKHRQRVIHAPSDLGCLVDAAGKEKVIALFIALNDPTAAGPPFDLLTQLLPAMQTCQVDLSASAGY